MDGPSPTGRTLYFDCGSPFAYLALERLDRFDFGELLLRPVALGALFKLTGRSSWGTGPRRELGMREIEARAEAYGLPPVRWPAGWPGNYLGINRACVAAEEQGRLEEFARAAMRMAFVDGEDLGGHPGGEQALLRLAGQAGLHVERLRERIGAQEVKDRLRAYTEEAFAAGVQGVPTLRIGERLFWGDDQLEIAQAWIASPG